VTELGDDRIELRGLRALGAHGALPEERVRSQPFEVDLDLFVDLSEAGRTDELADTVDYGRFAAAAVAVLEGPHVELIETLAERVAATVLAAAGERAQAVTVTLRKLRPPVAAALESAAVRITRSAGQ